ncbi:MAG: hypothetical protein AAGG48_31570 [Planctomycetota bacterium]
MAHNRVTWLLIGETLLITSSGLLVSVVQTKELAAIVVALAALAGVVLSVCIYQTVASAFDSIEAIKTTWKDYLEEHGIDAKHLPLPALTYDETGGLRSQRNVIKFIANVAIPLVWIIAGVIAVSVQANPSGGQFEIKTPLNLPAEQDQSR